MFKKKKSKKEKDFSKDFKVEKLEKRVELSCGIIKPVSTSSTSDNFRGIKF